MAGEVIAGLIGGAKPSPDQFAEIMFGKVISTSPLTIRVENKYTIDANTFQIILSEMVQRKVVKYLYPEVTVEAGSETTDYFTIPEYSTGFYVADNFEMSYPEIKYWYYNGDSQQQLTTSTDKPSINSYEYELKEINIPERSSSKAFVDSITHTKVTVKDIEKEIVLWEDLKTGEEVRMIRGKEAQLYYVIGRA